MSEFTVSGKLVLVDESGKTLGTFSSTVGRAMGEAEKSTRTFSDSASIAIGNFAAMLAKDAVQAASAFLKESISLGGSLESLSGGFKRLTKDVGEEVISLESLRSATKGTVGDVDLLRTANNALALGLPVDELNNLFEAAMNVGHAMGRDTLQAVNDLTTGIGRQSIRILDNLGIIVRTDEAYKEYAKALGKTVEQMTDAERKAAFMNAAMEALMESSEELAGTTSDTQIAIEKWNAAVDNAQTSLGVFLGTFVVGPLEAYTDILDVMTGRQKAWWMEVDESSDVLDGATHQMGINLEEQMNTSDLWAMVQSGNYATIDEAVAAYQDQLKASTMTHRETTEEIVGGTENMAQSTEDWAQRSIELYGQIDSSSEKYRDTQLRANQEVMAAQADTKATTEALTLSMDVMSLSAEDVAFALDEVKIQTETLELQQMKLKDAFDDGRLSEEAYEQQTALLDGQLRDLEITQTELELQSRTLESAYEDLDIATTALELATNALEMQMGVLGIASDEVRLEQMRLRDAYEDGEISEKEYRKESERLASEMRDLQIAEAELRLTTKKLGTAHDDAGDEMVDFDKIIKRLIDDLDLSEEEAVALKAAIEALKDKDIWVWTHYEDIEDEEEKKKKKEDEEQEWRVSCSMPGCGWSKKGTDKEALRDDVREHAKSQHPGWKASWTFSKVKKKKGKKSQFGFEGWVSGPQEFLAGEAGPEYVQIRPRWKVRRDEREGKARGGGGPTHINLNFPNVTALPEDPGMIDALGRRIVVWMEHEHNKY